MGCTTPARSRGTTESRRVRPVKPAPSGHANLAIDVKSAPSDRVRAALAGADPDRLVDRHHENLAVADAPGMGGLLDRLDGALDHRILHHHLDLHLGQEIDDVLRPAIELGMALLAAKALGLGDGDA